MPKSPSFQFYPGDWLRDPGVRSLTHLERGIYIDLLCLLHEMPRRGYLSFDGKTPAPEQKCSAMMALRGAKMLRKTIDMFLRVGVLKKDKKSGILYNKRMVDDELLLQHRRNSGSLGGLAKAKQSPSKPLANGLANAKQKAPPSSSSSSSSSSSIQNTNSMPSVEAFELAEEFRKAILARDPKVKLRNPDAWARDIDLMLRVDEREPEEIRKVIAWCQTEGNWWSPHVLSAKKLREKFDQMRGQMQRDAKPKRGMYDSEAVHDLIRRTAAKLSAEREGGSAK